MSFVNPFNQFEIKTFVPMSCFGLDISFTNSSLSVLTIVVILYVAAWYLRYYRTIYPSAVQVICESIYHFIKNIVLDTLGIEGIKFLPFIASVFLMILFGNLIGLIPGCFTITSHIIVTFILSLMVIIFTIITGVKHQGLEFMRIFFPKNIPALLYIIISPIEILTFFGRSISLSVRLFANMIAGHIMLDILFHFIYSANGILGYIIAAFASIAAVIIIFYEIFVACMQAYIFTVLSCTYIKDGLHYH